MTTKALALGTALVAVTAAPALSQESWTMTTTWPSSLELIETDRHFVELANALTGDELQIEFFEGGSLVPAGEVFGAVESGTVQAGGDWPGYWAGRDSAFSPLATTPALFNAVDYVNWIQQWGGAELYDEIYGQFGMVYLPYGVTNNESGFRTTDEPIRTLEDLQGKRLRLSGLEQGRLLERLGGNQVSMAGGEIYQSLERGVIDGAEFSTPNVDFSAGFQQVTDYWATPGWHQSASVFGVMINQQSWDALSEETQNKLEIAAEATLLWSLAFTEKRATEAYAKFEEEVEINRYDDETLEQVQQMANEVIVETACENPNSAKVYLSMIEYLDDYAKWRDASAPYNLGRTPNGPDAEALRECAG
ncbi:TRAP-type mannitol/chloroaromatic compound transport system, substrate-binding protein [Roseivivax halotolerans]|jgi:TRAP-type mannitol/chloroaromatic compound transport system substrate-binding protein|uniref:TRAP-type mannitol/chloroaromatic compound transport system, substrate-binding protein n=1 Tax=Roseivivax halotolerans TaxID=93684 RepID=A0A1I6A8Z7_9RHOB|nr:MULTISPECIES: TRAP transporter substrate-binding protein DctP [Roseivivax]QFT61927.1 Monocarboxylate 2-oxoacid-binding periplasmic protein precursor [Roseivivax sp. THAF30]SFQ65148.1 TRAP-type mannitol/chloroaromatic compound transport system, substrate-binding protein [Roseivivax halotolerans]